MILPDSDEWPNRTNGLLSGREHGGGGGDGDGVWLQSQR